MPYTGLYPRISDFVGGIPVSSHDEKLILGGEITNHVRHGADRPSGLIPRKIPRHADEHSRAFFRARLERLMVIDFINLQGHESVTPAMLISTRPQIPT